MDVHRKTLILVAWFAAAVVSAGQVGAASYPRRTSEAAGTARSFGVATLDNVRRIDVNSINMWVTNYGSFAWDLTTGNSGLVFPKGTSKTAVFASGIWFGAKVDGEVRTLVAEYSQEYGPGVILPDTTFDNASRRDYVVYKVVRYSGNPDDTARVELSADEQAADPLADPLVHHSWSEYVAGAGPYGAPTRVYRLPLTATSDPDDSVDVVGPDVLGDQMLWAVYNDLDPQNHSNDAGNSTPLGLEIQQTTFGFNRLGALGNTVFLKFKIINKGGQQLDSVFVSLWSDPDLGGFTDDLVGCDTTLSLGYCYNATNNDQLYGSAPPAIGYDFFRGPVDNVTGNTLGLASFNKYINGTDPASTSETYNYMRGLLPDGTPLVDPTNGQVTRFFHPGDPVLRRGWLDSNPSDRRFLMTAGPFAMAHGDTQEVVTAIIIGQGRNRISSVRALKFFDETAQLAFDLDFDLPSPPPQPKVQVTSRNREVSLCWDAVAANNPNAPEPDYTFQGYNVYQGESVVGPWRLIATYDVVDAITTVYDQQFDVETGEVIPQFPFTFGSNSGLSFCHTVTQDEVRGGGLKNATEYYFAVTAYSVDTTKVFPLPKVLENAQQVIRVIPQRPAAGTDLSTASATPVNQFQIDTSPQPTTDAPIVDVVTPDSVRTARYRIAFTPVTPPVSGQVGSDTATVRTAWNLIRTSLDGQSASDTLLRSQLNRRGDAHYQTVDGIRVRFSWPFGFETGSYFPVLLRADYEPRGSRSFNQAFSWSGNPSHLFGGAGFGKDFHDDETVPGDFGSNLDPEANPAAFTRVELQYGAGTQRAYRFLRYELGDASTVGLPGDSPPGGRRYDYGGFHEIPLLCMDVLKNRPLDVGFVERILVDSTGTILPTLMQPATFDSSYRPLGGDGGREYLFVFGREYDGTPEAAIAQDGAITSGVLPVMYALWAGQRGSRSLENSSPFRFDWVVPATPNDYFTFDTSPLTRGNAALARGLLDRIRVVPNPYYNRSRYELNQFTRIVRFTNLPETCTIRIFNLAGDQVRTLDKTNVTSSVLEWDLLTDNQLPVGSGVYIFHVDAPGAGTMFGRLVVFMETERLNNF